MTGTSTFNVRFRDQQLMTNASSVATLPGTPTALLVDCQLVQDRGDHADVAVVADCSGLTRAEPFTNDDAWRTAAKSLPVVQGRADRITFMHEGEYLFTNAIFDTRSSGPTDHNPGFNRSPSCACRVARRASRHRVPSFCTKGRAAHIWWVLATHLETGVTIFGGWTAGSSRHPRPRAITPIGSL